MLSWASISHCCKGPVKKQNDPSTGLDRPLGFQEVEAPIFPDNQYKQVVRLSDVHTGRIYLPGNIPGTHFF